MNSFMYVFRYKISLIFINTCIKIYLNELDDLTENTNKSIIIIWETVVDI